MFYKKKNFKLIEAFQYTDYDSIPSELKYSSSNLKGLIPINLPGRKCERCGQPSNVHISYFDNGFQRLICPGTYIVYKEGEILDLIDYNTFENNYYKIEVQEISYANSSKKETNN